MPSLPCAACRPAQCAHTRVGARDAHLMKMSYLSPLPHLHRDWAHLMQQLHRDWALTSCHISTGAGLAAATSASGLGASPPHLHRDWAYPRHICTERDWARRCHIFTGTGLAAATSAPGLGPTQPHLHRKGLGPPPPHLHRKGLGSPARLHVSRNQSARLPPTTPSRGPSRHCTGGRGRSGQGGSVSTGSSDYARLPQQVCARLQHRQMVGARRHPAWHSIAHGRVSRV